MLGARGSIKQRQNAIHPASALDIECELAGGLAPFRYLQQLPDQRYQQDGQYHEHQAERNAESQVV